MKYYAFIVLMCFSLIGFSQVSSNFNFEKYSQPDSKNELSLYLKKNISKSLLAEAKFPNKKNVILLSFSFNNEMEMYNIKTTTYNRELNDAIVNAFEKFPFEKLNIDLTEQNKNYTLQIISKKKGRNIFNCSSKVIIDIQPVCENCENFVQYEDIKECFVTDVKKYFYSNFNFDIADAKNSNLPSNLYISFKVNRLGKLIDSKSKVSSILLTDEINRVFSTYPTIKKLGTTDRRLRNDSYGFNITIYPNKKPVFNNKNEFFNKYTKPSIDSELSNYFSKNLTEELIEKSNLNSINDRLSILFELDKKNNPINISTNARSKELENKLIILFKNYPSKELPFLDKNPLNYIYSLQVLSYAEGKTIINCNSNIGYSRTPIYKGCEKSKNATELKKCLNIKIKEHLVKNFNYDPYKSQIDLKGKIKIYCQLRFEKGGDIIVLGIRSPHPLLKAEALRAINLMPRLTQPGYINGSPVNVTYMLPISANLN